MVTIREPLQFRTLNLTSIIGKSSLICLIMFEYIWKIFADTLKKFIADDALTMSAALAYYTAFSLAPLLIMAVSIAGAIFGQEAVSGVLHSELISTMGPDAAGVIQKIIISASKPADSVLMSVVGLILLLVGASSVFRQLQSALDKIWEVKATKSAGIKRLISQNITAFAMVLTTGFLLLVSMILTTLLQFLGNHLGHYSDFWMTTWLASSDFLSLVIATFLFAAIFKVLPNARIQWRDVWFGAVFTSLLFMVGKIIIGWYISHQATASTYGSAGSFVVLLTWLYYSSIIVMFGAEFTRAHTRHRRNKLKNEPD
jgi:membrane protein